MKRTPELEIVYMFFLDNIAYTMKINSSINKDAMVAMNVLIVR